MAAYLSLTDRTTGQIFEGASLIELDAQIAAALQIPVDPINWTLNWMNTIGLALAIGKTTSEIKQIFLDPLGEEDFAICESLINYIDNRFENTSFISR